MRNISLASDVASRASQAAGQVRTADQQAALYVAKQERLKASAFNESVRSLITGLGSAYALGKKTDWGGDSIDGTEEVLTNFQTEEDLTLEDKSLLVGLTEPLTDADTNLTQLEIDRSQGLPAVGEFTGRELETLKRLEERDDFTWGNYGVV